MVADYVDTLTMQFKVKTSNKEEMFNDFKNGVVYRVRKKWKCKTLRKPKIKTKICFKGKNALHFYYKGYDIFFKKKYPYSGKYGDYSLNYCHRKYRDDYVFIFISHNAIKDKTDDEIYQNTLELLESIGINIDFLEKGKLNRIDFKHDFVFENNPLQESRALRCILRICRDSYNGVIKEELKKGNGIKFKPRNAYIEVIVYDKYEERKSKLRNKKKTQQIDIEIAQYEDVFRIELRLKNKRLYYNTRNTFIIDKTLDNYFNEEIIDECFRRYVEPIFYAEPFYRLDYALLAINSDRRLNEKEAEKLSNLVVDINKKGFTKAKEEYKYSDDTFENHIKLLRSIGINPLTFDEDIDIAFLPNFTTKEVCRDFTIYDGEHEELKHHTFDEYCLKLD